MMHTRRGFLGYLSSVVITLFARQTHATALTEDMPGGQETVTLTQCVHQMDVLVTAYVVPRLTGNVYRPETNVVDSELGFASDAYPYYRVLRSEPCIKGEKIIPGADSCLASPSYVDSDAGILDRIPHGSTILRKKQRRRTFSQASPAQMKAYDYDENYLFGYGRVMNELEQI